VLTEFDGEVVSFDESSDGSGHWYYTIRYDDDHAEYLLDYEVGELVDDGSESSGLLWVRDGKVQHPAILDKTKYPVNIDGKA
jgi:hypothetical protein